MQIDWMYTTCTYTCTGVCACACICVDTTHPVLLCVAAGLPPETPMKTVFEHFRLDQNTIDFVGHALALYRDDE